jgi:Na+/H+-dicarboxylate symporter/ABC-type amino acid transport substrate-binding protein
VTETSAQNTPRSGEGEAKASLLATYSSRLPLWVAIGAVIGIFVGVFFGDQAAVLQPIGSTYVRLMEVVVFPYIICSLLVGLGRLSPDTALRLLRSSWLVYLMVWGITFVVIFLLSLAIPAAPPPSFIDATVADDSSGFLELLIPANPFLDLARNQLPAIVVFSIIYGIAIQKMKDKETFLSILDVIRTASVTIWNWVVLLAPVGVFALFASETGTLEASSLADLSFYLICFVFGTLILAFWILPSVISALCPVDNREILRDLQGGLVIAVVTSLSVAALPFIQQAAEKLAARMEIEDENVGEIVKTTLAISYPLAQLGNFFIWLFILFGAFYFRVPIDAGKQFALPFVTLLSGFGSPSSSIDAVAFLSSWLKFPDQATELYVGMTAITRYPQVIASVMGFAFVSFLVTLNYYGKLKLRPRRLISAVVVSAILLAAVTLTGRFIQARVIEKELPYLTYELSPDVTEGVSATIERPGGNVADAVTSDATPPHAESILDHIQKVGEIRVGYNPDIVPFSYENSRGDLVGFDIAYAYQLARDLNVNLRLTPFTWQNLAKDLSARRFDLAVAGIYVTEDRLREFVISEPYYASPVALIVRNEVAENYLSRESIEAQTDLTVAVFDDPIMIDLANRVLPGVKVVVLPSYAELEDHPEVDAAIWTLEQAKAWTAPRSSYVAVVPKNLGGQFLIAYLMPDNAGQLREFLNYWMRLQRINGFHERMARQWIDGKPETKLQPRWSIARNVLGWGVD